ncbi:MAG: hypothetical protein E7353_02375 [Clostridiales bacterium]|nr:hypothetical protein [Clostridiales bacterium]
MKKTVDMTKGSPFKLLLFFSLPIALGFVLQQLYSLGDSFIVSLSLGHNAVTGVNVTGSMTFMVLGFAQGISAGFGIVLAQYVGSKDEHNMRKTVGSAILLTVIITAILSVITVILSRPLLALLETHEDFIDHADSYIKTIFAGLVFTTLYNLSDQIMRAMGDSKTPVLILILCAILNLGLNSLLFIFPSLTVAWAGWATVISQGISAIVGFIVIFKKFPVLRLKLHHFRLKFRFCMKLLAMGLPMAIQFVITASGCMIQQRAFNILPDPNYAMAQGTAGKIDNIFGMVLNGCGAAMATYAGQNYGAKNYNRLRQGLKAGLLVGLIYTAFSTIGAISLAIPLTYLLLPSAPSVVFTYSQQYLTIQGICYYFLFALFLFRQALQAVGKSSLTILGGIVELVLRIFVSFTFAIWFGFDGACISNPLAWLGGALCFIFLFIAVAKKFPHADYNVRVGEEKTLASSSSNEV